MRVLSHFTRWSENGTLQVLDAFARVVCTCPSEKLARRVCDALDAPDIHGVRTRNHAEIPPTEQTIDEAISRVSRAYLESCTNTQMALVSDVLCSVKCELFDVQDSEELKPSLEDLGYELEKTAAQRDALLEALRGFEATVCVAAKRGEGLGVLSVFSLHKRARAAPAEGEQ